MIGIWEWLGIIVLALIVLWILGKKFKEDAPTVARSAGRSISEFKEGLKEIPEAIKNSGTKKKK